MSENGKLGRQGKLIAKTDFHFRIQNEAYDWLCSVAIQKGVSVAKLLNAILRSRPEPDEWFIK